MNHRCPLCGKDLGSRKLAGSVVARMHLDCPYCRGRLRVNVHAVERLLVLGTAAGCVALAAVAYARQSQGLLLAALALGTAGAAALYLVERTALRAWPRYARREVE